MAEVVKLNFRFAWFTVDQTD